LANALNDMRCEPARILVADDERITRNVLRFGLEQKGFAVTVARDGGQAWELLRAEEFDLVVTDYQMPVMNGEELCRRMRQDERLRGTPVLLLSAKGMEIDAAQFRREFGVYAIIFKPFSPAGVAATIDACLREKAQLV